MIRVRRVRSMVPRVESSTFRWARRDGAFGVIIGNQFHGVTFRRTGL